MEGEKGECDGLIVRFDGCALSFLGTPAFVFCLQDKPAVFCFVQGSFNMVGVQHATVGAVAGADEPAPQNADPLRCLPLAQNHSMPVWQASVGRVEGELKRRTCSVLVALWLCLAHLAMPPTLPNGTSMAGGGAWRKRQDFQQHCRAWPAMSWDSASPPLQLGDLCSVFL